MKKYISAKADKRLSGLLRQFGYDPVPVECPGIVADGLSCHPDIFMCRLGIRDDSEIFFSREFAALYEEGHDSSDEPDSLCGSEAADTLSGNCFLLGEKYPFDIAYNAACTGKYFIHDLRYTAPGLCARAKELGMTPVGVRQGYTKCSTVIMDENSIITYDKGIALPCGRAGMDVLLIRPGHILLPGYDTGFIGGTSGRIGEAVIFNGNLDAHPDAAAIRAFIKEHGLDVISIPDYPLTDIGSII